MPRVAPRPPPAPRLVVVQALPKGDRGELAVEAMTEVGVDVIVPWAADAVRDPLAGQRGDKALRSGDDGARGGQAVPPRPVPEVTELADDPRGSTGSRRRRPRRPARGGRGCRWPRLDAARRRRGRGRRRPGGRLSPDELAVFAGAGATAYRLGPTVLRTSTAGAAALAVVLSRTARWGAATRP